MPLGLPIRVRLHFKGTTETYFDLAEEMLRGVAVVVPGCRASVCADGFYAALAAEAAALGLFSLTTATRHQQAVDRLVYTRGVFWDGCWVRLVVVRDPAGHEADDFFFTTALDASALEIPDQYGGLWSIALTFRDVTQLVGGQEPQCWADDGPARAAAVGYWLYTLVWTVFLLASAADHRQACRPTPWYPHPQIAPPSFGDALAWLRRALWHQRISARAHADLAPAIIPADVEMLINHAALCQQKFSLRNA